MGKMQRRTAANTSFSPAKRVVFRKQKIIAFEMTQICVTSILLCSFWLFIAKFSTNFLQYPGFQQEKGLLQNFRFATAPFTLTDQR
jgi:hypothetical protein